MKLAAYSQVGRGDIMQRGFQGACSTRNAPLTEHHGDTDGSGRSAGHRTAFRALIDAHRTCWAFLAPRTDTRLLPDVLRHPGAPSADTRLLPGRAAAARRTPHAPQ